MLLCFRSKCSKRRGRQAFLSRACPSCKILHPRLVKQATQLYFPEAVESAEFVRGEGGGLELVVSARGQPHLTYVDVETLQQRRVS